jgi:hypothetical protein
MRGVWDVVLDGVRSEPCLVCGETLRAPDGDWDAIAAVVLTHGRTRRHRSRSAAATALAALRRAQREAMRDEIEQIRLERAVRRATNEARRGARERETLVRGAA